MNHTNEALINIVSAITDLRNIVKEINPGANFNHVDASLAEAHKAILAAKIWQH